MGMLAIGAAIVEAATTALIGDEEGVGELVEEGAEDVAELVSAVECEEASATS